MFRSLVNFGDLGGPSVKSYDREMESTRFLLELLHHLDLGRWLDLILTNERGTGEPMRRREKENVWYTS